MEDDHGITDTHTPLLRKLTNIQHADAIMRYNADNKPYEPEWPAADFIISTDQEVLAHLLALNHQRAAQQP